MVRNSASTAPSQRYHYALYIRYCAAKKRLQMHVSANDVITESGENKVDRV